MNRCKKLLITFFLFLLLFSMGNLGDILIDNYMLEAQVKELEQQRTTGITIPLPGNQVEPIGTKKVVLPEFQKLVLQNKDIVGWLEIAGTQVNYPVMQSYENPEYYLNHDFGGKENKNGLPFLDARYKINESDVLLIHGHNMRSGLIFNELMKYKKESFYQKHSNIQFNTLYEKGTYEIVAVILSKVYQKEDVFKYYEFVSFKTETEFEYFFKNIRQLSLYDTGRTAQFGDQFIILSTCEYSTENGRLAVVARKM